MKQRGISLISVFALLFGLGNIAISSSSFAAKCPPISKNTKSMGLMIGDGITTQVKSANYPAGGVFDPPESPLAIGLSARHQPLSATEGSSLLVWHISYSGCQGRINYLTKKKVGYEFTIVDERAGSRDYKISSIQIIPVGKYNKDWFALSGPRQLVFVTCTGRVVKGHHTQNWVMIATPV